MSYYGRSTGKLCTGKVIKDYVLPGTSYGGNTKNVGTLAAPFGILNSRVIDASDTITTAAVVKTNDSAMVLTTTGTVATGLGTITNLPENKGCVVYSTTGSVPSINTTYTTFSTNATGECGLFLLYTVDYSASYFGEYNHTSAPVVYISTGSPALQAQISGSDLQVKFASSTTPATIYWKKLKFN